MRKAAFSFFVFFTCLALTMSNVAYAEPAAINPDFLYFYKGDTPDGWHWVLSDFGNWWMPLDANEGVSEGKKIRMEASNSPEFAEAIKLTWSKKGEWGSASITGRSVDLSAYDNRAELVIVAKLEARVRKPVKIEILCGDKCEAEVNIDEYLKKAPLKKWFALPIPLDCFVAQGANLKNITSPFAIGTDGKMILHIAQISVIAMAAGDEGCVPNSDTNNK